jgi:hypothetical protein
MSHEGTIVFSLFTYINVKQEELGHQFLKIICNNALGYAPEKVDFGSNWDILNCKDLSPQIQMWTKADNILFKRENKFQSELAVFLGNLASTPKGISFWIDKSFFVEETHVQEFLDTCRSLYELLRPYYGYVHDTEDVIDKATRNDLKFGKTVFPVNLIRGLPGIYWVNFFGPELVEKLGKEKILSAPFFLHEWLRDGGILFSFGRTPLDQQDPEKEKMRMEFRKHIGTENFYP